MRTLLACALGAITFDHTRQARRPFRRALRDLPSPRPDAAGRETHHENRAVLIDLDARTMHVANGPPCSNEYVPFAV